MTKTTKGGIFPADLTKATDLPKSGGVKIHVLRRVMSAKYCLFPSGMQLLYKNKLQQ